MFSLVLAFLLSAVMHRAAGTLLLDVSPTDMTPGLTESLTVNCSFSFVGVPYTFEIVSLIVSKSEVNESQFLDLVSVNAFKPDTLTELSQIGGVVTGQMDVQSESFITIEWPYPTANESGVYKCEIDGMDPTLHLIDLSQTKMVASRKANLDQVIDKVGQLQRRLKFQESLAKKQSDDITMLQSKLEQNDFLAKNQSNEIYLTLNSRLGRQDNLSKNQADEIVMLQSKLEEHEILSKNQSDEITLLESQLEQQENFTMIQSGIISAQEFQLHSLKTTITRLESKMNLLMSFYVSSQYRNGHYYLLSKQAWHSTTDAAETCEDQGGYLVAINDEDEFQFLKDFIGQYDGFVYVLMNGTDAGHEGRWTYMGTNINLAVTHWMPDAPRTLGTANCVYMPTDTWLMWDGYCQVSGDIRYKFVCELESM